MTAQTQPPLGRSGILITLAAFIIVVAGMKEVQSLLVPVPQPVRLVPRQQVLLGV